MDLNNSFPIILGLSTIIGLGLAVGSLRRSGTQKAVELYQHLLEIGTKASMLEEGSNQLEVGRKHSWAQKSVGTIKLNDRNIDAISVVGMATQYGVKYSIEYLVRISSFIGGMKGGQTKMVRKRTGAFWDKLVDIEWQGDKSLAPRLNLDSRLKEKSLSTDPGILKGGIRIYPEPKYGYARIRTSYALPAAEFLKTVSIIASHIRSGW
jgi:hypothetical protein